MQNVLLNLSRELAAEITEEVKIINLNLTSGDLSQSQIKGQLAYKKLLNADRIKALGLFLIEGGKYE